MRRNVTAVEFVFCYEEKDHNTKGKRYVKPKFFRQDSSLGTHLGKATGRLFPVASLLMTSLLKRREREVKTAIASERERRERETLNEDNEREVRERETDCFFSMEYICENVLREKEKFIGERETNR